MISETLKHVLDHYPNVARPDAPPEPLGNAGGFSGSQLWRFSALAGPLVLRSWPSNGPSAAAVRQIHAWLALTNRLRFVPIPVADRRGFTVQWVDDRAWDLCPWMPGEAHPDPERTSAQLRAGFAGLAMFHRALSQLSAHAPSPGLLGRLDEIEKLLGGEFDAIERAVERFPDDLARPAALRWLALARIYAPRLVVPLRRTRGIRVRLQPCLRDARPEHFLFLDDRLTGLIDFGAMGMEVVACDLGRLLSEWVGADRHARGEALAAYSAVQALNEAELSLIQLFEDSAALLGAGRWIRWHFVERKSFEDRGAVVNGIARGLERLTRLVAVQR